MKYSIIVLSFMLSLLINSCGVYNFTGAKPVDAKTFQEPLNISADLKTISINLEDTHSDSLDYKKLSLPKLRSIVSEKGLATDASKLKKNELLKLLGAE